MFLSILAGLRGNTQDIIARVEGSVQFETFAQVEDVASSGNLSCTDPSFYPKSTRISHHQGRLLSTFEQEQLPSQDEGPIDLFSCSLCSEVFVTQKELCLHTRQLHKKHLCIVCFKMFNSFQALSYHRNAKHAWKENLMCHLCGKSFAHMQHKNRHMKNEHGNRDA